MCKWKRAAANHRCAPCRRRERGLLYEMLGSTKSGDSKAWKTIVIGGNKVIGYGTCKKLASRWIMVKHCAEAGPAGIFTHKKVFTSIYNTIKQVFKYVMAYTTHAPFLADTWGWVMASDQPFLIGAEEMDKRIKVDAELLASPPPESPFLSSAASSLPSSSAKPSMEPKSCCIQRHGHVDLTRPRCGPRRGRWTSKEWKIVEDFEEWKAAAATVVVEEEDEDDDDDDEEYGDREAEA
ncbi:thermospermine synthase ACAULIS5-like [Senna tora]|uniref:Thermospermine synthase ACAULIS5-like n=1 Tax=Senna tora TaxID=362788 RepID=A0A835C263_9FABA|nr:thermospermine synthase ACAULIS5-like [Senna tora]